MQFIIMEKHSNQINTPNLPFHGKFRGKGRKRLFISHLASYEKEISADTISRWIVQTIKLAYNLNSIEHSKINAHEVRALVSSCAWLNSVPLEEVVKASFEPLKTPL